MALLTASSTRLTPSFSAEKPSTSLPKPHHFSLRSLSSEIRPLKFKCAAGLSPLLSDPQTPASARRGAEADVMGLLLRERIVYLGNQIDDFVADAIISQLLLLDAQNPNKDIRLFVNSPGGSLR